MRIAIFSDTYIPEINGVARTLSQLTTYLTKKDISFQVFAPDTKGTVPGVPHINRFTSLSFFLYPECRLALPNLLHMKAVLNEYQPSLIHIATPFNMGLAGLQYGKKHNIPMVASYHTNFDEYVKHYHMPFLEKWIWNYMRWFHRPFSKVYVPSISTKEKIVQKGVHQNVDIWGRGVDTERFTPQKQNDEIKHKYGIKGQKKLFYMSVG